ncbi:MAG: hypothetical protein PHZ26_02165 [Candidatus Gracilibacteria bacterium]|nr:hypothetical protein [Candidatus Gracilibacteria bacterium]MDD2908540.1 hypothetical protein [Candidatus Gracilibacteria bacterium]
MKKLSKLFILSLGLFLTTSQKTIGIMTFYGCEGGTIEPVLTYKDIGWWLQLPLKIIIPLILLIIGFTIGLIIIIKKNSKRNVKRNIKTMTTEDLDNLQK